MDDKAREDLKQIYTAAVAAVDPYVCVKENLALSPGVLVAGGAAYPLSDIGRIYLLAAGKAAYGMARAAEEVLGELVTDGAVVTKDGHGGPLEHVELYEASHPVPDDRGVYAAGRILAFAKNAGDDDLVLCLLSGGASALMVQPADDLTLADKQSVTKLMLSSGADIGEVNCVRKHLSAVKGGRLAEAAFPARVVSLVVSDVIGDDLGVIASGPTAPDETTFIQAVEILKIRGAYDRIPPRVSTFLEQGAIGKRPETPKPGDRVFNRVQNHLVAFNMAALNKAAEVAAYLGYNPRIVDAASSGDASRFARRVAADALEAKSSSEKKPLCLIYGGETTVNVRGGGLGGRNQEAALAFAVEMRDVPGVSALFAGTDGTDGTTDAAGAFADGSTEEAAAKMGLDAQDYLDENDSYHFFKSAGGLFVPGPTGTNVMDVTLVLVR